MLCTGSLSEPAAAVLSFPCQEVRLSEDLRGLSLEDREEREQALEQCVRER